MRTLLALSCSLSVLALVAAAYALHRSGVNGSAKRRIEGDVADLRTRSSTLEVELREL